jgi:hypothetical protein
MTDDFTTRFIDDAPAFAILHEQMKKRGYVTEADEPHLNRPIHNSLTEDRYQKIFETHFPSQYTNVKAAKCAFDTGSGFPDFYVAYNSAQLDDRDAVESALKQAGIL